jgi:hypothetical protein
LNSTTSAPVSRNFYLIGHGCNDLDKINKALRQKVNGIECDLWEDDDKKWWISHEGLSKTDLKEWLSHITIAEKKFKRQLSVIVFDVKTAGLFKGVRDIINSTLPPDLPRIYSTAKIEMAHIFAEVVPLLEPHEGIAVDEEDNPAEVAAFFRKIGATQCWYGNGITLIPLNEEFHECMQQAAPIRDTTGPFSKIYTWSVHRTKALRKYIEEDKVDGIIVGLNGILSRPVSNALKIIRDSKEVQLADRRSKLF